MNEHTCSFVENPKLDCGCEIMTCSVCGVGMSVGKCKFHKPVPHDSDIYYLHEMSGRVGNIPRAAVVCNEFITALKEMDREISLGRSEKRVLDIGAGIGNNAVMFLNKGYIYEACEPNDWAGKYMEGAYGATVYRTPFDTFPDTENYDAVIASHVLEHFDKAKVMLRKMFNILKKAGIIYILIPDSTDLGNPDHLWFFNEHTIQVWMEEAGFVNVKTVTRQVVAHEKFIYVVGEKNG